MLNLVLISLVVILSYKISLFFLSLILKRNDIADVSWGISFIIISFISLFFSQFTERIQIVFALIVIWGLRLAFRIYLRNRGKREDFRYKKLRKDAGGNIIIRAFFQVYLLQGILALVVISPIFLISIYDTGGFNFLDYVGISIWIVGFIFESVADYQLDQFTKNPINKGGVLKTGLWRYSRHPNYFGEIIMWWAIYLITLSVPFGYFSFFGPLVISFLILKVSGIPPLEKRFLGNKDFERYKKETSIFFPLPRKSLN